MRIHYREKTKKVVFSILMVAFTLMFCFLVLQYGFANFYYSDVDQKRNKRFDPVLGWLYQPGTYWVKPSHSFSKHVIYINKHGLRNRDIASNQEAGTRRILILGDSFTFGHAVPHRDLFSTKLEQTLNQNLAAKYEVINAGVEGYSNAQQLLLMRKLCDDNILAEVYLLTVFTNDIIDNLRRTHSNKEPNLAQPGFVLDSSGKMELKYVPKRVSPKRKRENITLAKTLKVKIESFLQTAPALVTFLNNLGFSVKFSRMPGLVNSWYQEDILEVGIPLMKEIIKEIRNEAHKRNSKLLVTLIPSPLQIYQDTYGPILKETFPDNQQVDSLLNDITRPQRTLKMICDDLALPTLDLYPILLENNDRELFIPRDGHLNADAHTIVASSLARFITAQDKPSLRTLSSGSLISRRTESH